MFDFYSPLTHDNLLKVLPFGCAYMSDEYDQPSMLSLQIALALRTLKPYSDSHKEKVYEIN